MYPRATFRIGSRGISLLCAMNMTDQSAIRTLGEGIVLVAHLAEGSIVPVTAKFVEAYTA
jgi:hypothetical protein